jgi:RES domain-containing protein
VTITVFRIVKRKHVATAFTGYGAKLAGGRWNSPGIAVVYASATLSLAALEILVHVDSPAILDNYVAYEIHLDNALIESPIRLPNDWKVEAPPRSTQRIGDRWLEEMRSVAFQVPSAVIPSEWNYALNPNHPDFAHIRIGRAKRFKFDPRLF